MKIQLKKLGTHTLAIVIFVLLVVIYFAPSIFENKTIQQTDYIKYLGMSQEVREYAKTEESKDFDVIGWTGSMFSGMPTYTISTQKAPKNFIDYLEMPVKKLNENGAGMVLAGLISFYILMCVMGVNFWLAIAGAIAFAFASYNIIIIDAGHITKAYVIAYMPLTLAGMLMVFKKKWLLGAAVTILGITLSLKNNHIQITYYLAFLCVTLYLAYLVNQIRQKEYANLGKVTGLFIICVIVAILPNISSLYANYEMSKESIRGKSELTEKTTGDVRKESDGLDIDYAFAWSYGKGETMTMLIPNFYGGVSKPFDSESETYKAIMSNLRAGKISESDANALYGRGSQYWGDQPFTSGPVYFGALICFLFLLGMFAIKNPVKWWILGVTVLLVLMSWGKNFAFLNEFLFHHLPLYNKFRVPSMSLVVPSLTFVLIAIWGLKVILSGEVDKKVLQKYFYYSFGVTAGLCLIFWLFPGVFLDFSSSNDITVRGFEWYNRALENDREALLKSDALRSLMFILLGGALIFWFIRSKEPAKISKYIAIGIVLLVLADLWAVDKRYVNYDTFTAQKPQSAFKKTTVDTFILQDTDPSYRVLNLNNPFQESFTSYYHKSIGGYNAAKLRRYQEMIDYQMENELKTIINDFQHVQTYADLQDMPAFENTPVLNMLNTRYVIFDKEQMPIVNTHAYGNAWFVDNLRVVENADEEMAALKQIDPAKTALVDKRFEEDIQNFTFNKDENASIELVHYEPVKLVYKSNAGSDQLAVFSEIYYPYGWEVEIDGKPASHFRTNWTLRGMVVPAGEHTIEFKFIPRQYITAARIASVSSVLIMLFLIFSLGWTWWKKSKEEDSKE